MNTDKIYYFLINNKMTLFTDDPSIKSLKKWLISKNIFNSKDNIHIDRLTEKEFDYFNSKLFKSYNSFYCSQYVDYY